MEKNGKLNILAAVVVSTLISVTLCFMIVYSQSTLPWSEASGFFFIPVVFLILISIVMVPVSIFGLISKKSRKTAIYLLVFSSIYLSTTFSCVNMDVTMKWRMHEFKKLAIRSKPLVTAINDYEIKYGSPPPGLQSLVPEFLPEVPQTGTDRDSSYNYIKSSEFRYEDNPWMLEVSAGSLFGFDRFLYLPNQNYPEYGWGGKLEKIEDWAYVHE
jgi:hypothetical protein